MKEVSYVMVKPHFANHKNVIDYVKARLTEELGLTIEKEAVVKYDRKNAQKHYAEHFRGSYENAKGFYKELEDYITSDVAYGMKVSGEDVIAKVRSITGSTIKVDKETGAEILPAQGTIRYEVPIMLGEKHGMTENVLHASDKPESAVAELAIFEELASAYEKVNG